MGQLLFTSKLDASLDATWYFKELRYRQSKSQSWRSQLDWHDTVQANYPHIVYVDREALGRGDIERLTSEQRENRIAIRRFVNEHADNETFIRYEELSFRYQWNMKTTFTYDSDYSSVDHGYYILYFEHASEAVAFKLRFTSFVCERHLIPEAYDFLTPAQRKTLRYADARINEEVAESLETTENES